jgi:hypothetical protein
MLDNFVCSLADESNEPGNYATTGINSLTTMFQMQRLYTVFIVQTYQTSQYVVPRGGIFLSKWRSSFVGSSGGKMNVQSACALNIRYIAE